MFSGISIYVLDANAIRKLNYDQIVGKKNANRLLTTIEDVEHEVRGLEKLDLLEIQKLDSNTFQKLSEIINNYECVRNLVSYYENKGTGDVGLLAYALTANDEKLFKDKIIIITDDKGLRTACNELGVKWLPVDDFKLL